MKANEDLCNPLTPEERRKLIEAPLAFNYYGGKSFSGMQYREDRDDAFFRYRRDWHFAQFTEDGYLPE